MCVHGTHARTLTRVNMLFKDLITLLNHYLCFVSSNLQLLVYNWLKVLYINPYKVILADISAPPLEKQHNSTAA